MTKTTLRLELRSGAKRLTLGPGEALDITKITGLESSELEVGLSDLATVDGSSLDGKHVKARPIHLEGSFRSLAEPADKREQLIRFFNPKYTGWLVATIGDRTRYINYELEGWTLKERRNLDARVGFIADLICPDPYFLGPETTLEDMTDIVNSGDVESGWYAEFVATGTVRNPEVLNADTGEYMRVLYTLEAGDVLAVSTEDRQQSITLNGESAFRLIDRRSTPFKLLPGSNTVVITSDLGTPNATFRFRERFFGI